MNKHRARTPRSRLLIEILLLALVVGAAWYMCQTPAPDTSRPVTHTYTGGLASDALNRLETKGRGESTGYSRDEFGAAWSDGNAQSTVQGSRNGCDTRNDILTRDLRDVKRISGSKCLVASGTLSDPYTGKDIEFKRGNDTSTKVQIDHVIPEKLAWEKGMGRRSAQERLEFANDPLNLIATDGPTNGAKQAFDYATWQPPNKAFRCAYVARQVAVEKKYNLPVFPAERLAMEKTLATCPNQRLPLDTDESVKLR